MPYVAHLLLLLLFLLFFAFFFDFVRFFLFSCVAPIKYEQYIFVFWAPWL